MMSPCGRVVLNGGTEMPVIGLGTYTTTGPIGQALEVAIKVGCRLIDCASMYENEAEIGDVLQKCLIEGVCKRKDLFITSKLWNTEHCEAKVLPAITATLKNLKLEYLDLYLIHWPLTLTEDLDLLGYSEARITSCWKGMEYVMRKGFTKAIGLSNFTITKTEKLLETACILPAVLQVECHPYLQQDKLIEYCASKGIVFQAHSPFASPTNPFVKSSDPVLLNDSTVKRIANKHSATPAQVCLSFQLQRGNIVIFKTTNPNRVLENLKSTKLKLDLNDMMELRKIDCKFRVWSGEMFFDDKQDFMPQKIWDVKEDDAYIVKTDLNIRSLY